MVKEKRIGKLDEDMAQKRKRDRYGKFKSGMSEGREGSYLEVAKFIVVFAIATSLAIITGGLIAFAHANPENYYQFFPQANLTISGATLPIVEATTPLEQTTGFMNSTEPLANCSLNCGILFEFTNYANQCFWMHDTSFPIVMVWMNLTGFSLFTPQSTDNQNTSFTAIYTYRPVVIAYDSPNNNIPTCHYGNAVLELPLTIANRYFNLGLNDVIHVSQVI